MEKAAPISISRICELPRNNSFFLFGARGTGKTTLLKQLPFLQGALYIDLLTADAEENYGLRPGLLLEQAAALNKGDWIVIDEIQKSPKLLDYVHKIIEEYGIHFALTGSSSRKLKRGGANLLAGRAYSFSLFPFSCFELKEKFDLESALQWGTLPKISSLTTEREKSRFLRTYTQTYLREEILIEQLIRNLDPFRLFLPIAAQMNSQLINYSNISKDTGVDYKTVQKYYQILVDTNLGFFLEPYGRSVRKVQKRSPKFYFFDTGAKRALERRLNVPLTPQTTEYGEAFETWFINECFRLNHYLEKDFEFHFLQTKDNVEVDLIVDRPGNHPMLIEVKSASMIDERHVKSLLHFRSDFPDAELICIGRVSKAQKIGDVLVLPWKQALHKIGFS